MTVVRLLCGRCEVCLKARSTKPPHVPIAPGPEEEGGEEETVTVEQWSLDGVEYFVNRATLTMYSKEGEELGRWGEGETAGFPVPEERDEVELDTKAVLEAELLSMGFDQDRVKMVLEAGVLTVDDAVSLLC